MKTPIVRVYIGYKLTKADRVFLARMEAVKAALKIQLPNCQFLDFLGMTTGDAAAVYQRDILVNIATCDLFVAVADEESTGLGYELCAAVEVYRKPVLLVALGGSRVSRLPLGAISYFPAQIIECRVGQYEDIRFHIEGAIKNFRLDTLDPVVFLPPPPNSMLNNPTGGRHGEVLPSAERAAADLHLDLKFVP